MGDPGVSGTLGQGGSGSGGGGGGGEFGGGSGGNGALYPASPGFSEAAGAGGGGGGSSYGGGVSNYQLINDSNCLIGCSDPSLISTNQGNGEAVITYTAGPASTPISTPNSSPGPKALAFTGLNLWPLLGVGSISILGGAAMVITSSKGRRKLLGRSEDR